MPVTGITDESRISVGSFDLRARTRGHGDPRPGFLERRPRRMPITVRGDRDQQLAMDPLQKLSIYPVFQISGAQKDEKK
ncbi:MAG: hypothetical protein V3R94_09990 [Acidobacteriota bacterium]